MTAPVGDPARPDAVSSAGETLAASGASMLETSQAAVRAAAPAVDNVWGFLTHLVANVSDPLPQTTESGDPQRNPGREDREDERESGDPDRPVVPDNNRDTGEPRGN